MACVMRSFMVVNRRVRLKRELQAKRLHNCFYRQFFLIHGEILQLFICQTSSFWVRYKSPEKGGRLTLYESVRGCRVAVIETRLITFRDKHYQINTNDFMLRVYSVVEVPSPCLETQISIFILCFLSSKVLLESLV